MLSINRRSFNAWLGGAAVALAAVFAGASPSVAADKIKLGALNLASHAPSFIALEKKYFEEQGLDVELVFFQAAQPMAVAIASGDVDFGITAISAGLVSLSEKGAIKVIGGSLEEVPGIEGQKILVSNKAYEAGVKTPADLKGHSFGITTAGSSFHYMAHKIADKEGFPRSELKLTPLQKVGAIIASLKSGQIDAWSIVPNIADGLTKNKEAVEIGKIADYIPNYQVTTVFTSTKNTQEKKDEVKRFLAAFSKGVADYNAALVEKKMSDADTQAIVEIIHHYVYSDQPIEKAGPRIRAGAMQASPNAKLNMASVKDQLEWFKSEKLVPADAKLENLVDPSFVETE